MAFNHVRTLFFCAQVEDPNADHSPGTQNVRFYSFIRKDTVVYLVDTPGFDDTNVSDVDVLRELASWLKESYTEDIKLDGII